MTACLPRSLNPAFDGQQRLDFIASRLNPEFSRLMSDGQLLVQCRCANIHKASVSKLGAFWSMCNEMVSAISDLEASTGLNDANPKVNENVA